MIIDLSHPLDETTPPWPGDPAVELRRLFCEELDGESGARVHTTGLSMSCHCGTHMDAPFHFFAAGTTIDRVALDTCCGPAVFVRLRELSGGGTIDVEHVEPLSPRIREVRRVVFDTGWAQRWNTPGYFEKHPVISEELARLLVDWGVGLVGVDFPSVDRPPWPTHKVLLGSGAVIVENLTGLDGIVGDEFVLVTLPLAVAGRDGSPVRAAAIFEDGARAS